MMADALTIILVEGVSDIAFLNLYICHKYHFEYAGRLKISNKRYSGERYSRKREGGSDETLSNLFSHDLRIVSCDGHTNFVDAYQNIACPMMMEAPAKTILRLIVLTDADASPEEIRRFISLPDAEFMSLDVFLSEDANAVPTLKDSFGQIRPFRPYVQTIPCDGEGCLETVLLTAISRDDPNIVKESTRFVDGLSPDARKHIMRKRDGIKAKTGVVFSLLDPDSPFDDLKQKFGLIDLNSPALEEQFRCLSFLSE